MSGDARWPLVDAVAYNVETAGRPAAFGPPGDARFDEGADGVDGLLTIVARCFALPDDIEGCGQDALRQSI